MHGPAGAVRTLCLAEGCRSGRGPCRRVPIGYRTVSRASNPSRLFVLAQAFAVATAGGRRSRSGSESARAAAARKKAVLAPRHVPPIELVGRRPVSGWVCPYRGQRRLTQTLFSARAQP